MSAFLPLERKIVSITDLVSKLSASQNKITTNGCFDILHYGHIHYLNEAKKLGGTLICLVNSDTSVKQLKGKDRPIFPLEVRMKQLAALEAVDYVSWFEEATPVEALKKIKPHTHVKGADYRDKEIPEKALVKTWGGNLAFLEFVQGFSTSSILKKILD